MSLILFNEVLNTIPQYLQKNKRLAGLLATTGLIFVVVSTVGLSAFFLGRIVSATQSRCPLTIDTAQDVLTKEIQELKPYESPQSTEPQKIEVSIAGRAGGVVVSKNGTKYHFPWCPGAGQIKEENKVWYATEKDAQSAGYTKAGNCQ